MCICLLGKICYKEFILMIMGASASRICSNAHRPEVRRAGIQMETKDSLMCGWGSG